MPLDQFAAKCNAPACDNGLLPGGIICDRCYGSGKMVFHTPRVSPPLTAQQRAVFNLVISFGIALIAILVYVATHR